MLDVIKGNVERLRRNIGKVSSLPLLTKVEVAEQVLSQISVILDQIGGELERQASRLAVVEELLTMEDENSDANAT